MHFVMCISGSIIWPHCKCTSEQAYHSVTQTDTQPLGKETEVFMVSQSFHILSLQTKGKKGWVPANMEPSQTEPLSSWGVGITRLFRHHRAQNYTKAGISVSLPLLAPHNHRSLHLPPPLVLSGICCLVPPLGCSTDAGWRHSGLILLLLMLMLKEAIGTCYFFC